MTDEAQTPDGATDDTTSTEQDSQPSADSGDIAYLKDELKKVIGQRDALKAEKREREATDASVSEAARQAALSLEEKLKESQAAYAKLQADVRTNDIHRVLLAGVPEANKEAVLTIYTANEIGLNDPSLTPTEVGTKALDLIQKIAAPLLSETSLNEDIKPEPKPATKLKGQPAGESPNEHLRPDVRAAKAQAAFRKKYPGFGSGFGL